MVDIDIATREWIRNVTDERAAADGCRFDEDRAVFACEWIESYCHLYEGEQAGQPLTLMPWQRDITMRMFGWVRHSEHWQREIRRFRQASVWAAKKNGKTPLLAAWAMYLLIGDGEPGAKVFLGAKDGQQVRTNLARHCHEMLRQSPQLSEQCKANKNQMSVFHEPSRSVLMPLSSSNERTTDAKEGLNGCLMIDETHVVDDSFMGKLDRMHLSRAEPFQIEVSTAGSNPEGYGKKRFDYAQRVLDGNVTDHQLFAEIYAAPQDTTDEQIHADPLKFGKMANPSIGVLIDPAEYMADYTKSRDSLTEFTRFKMYRLNIWSASANPWLRSEHWQACYAEFTEDDFLGETCHAGLDLARSRDLTALVLMFERDGVLYQLPYFFMPEETAKSRKEAGYMEWAKAGKLILTPGDVCDYEFVFNEVARLNELFHIEQIAFDPYNAEPITQRFQEELAIDRILFPQTIARLAGPTAEYERRIIAGELKHNGHPVLSWQAGHVEVKSDANKNIRPVKRKHGDYRTIDGVVAGIMALASWELDQSEAFAVGDAVSL